MKKAITIILLLAVIINVSLYSLCTPVLRYSEGWGTFFWDKHFLADSISQYGLCETLRLFFLQFFAVPAKGVYVMSGIGVIVALMMLLLVRFFSRKALLLYISLVPSLLCTLGLLVLVSPVGLSALNYRFSSSNQANNQYIELSNKARLQDWDGIVTTCEQSGRITNLLTQNFLNMALAEKGQLGNRLFDEPCQDIRSIYIDVITEPDFAMLLSDIYYSMGHIAQAQRYAFELNEKKNDMSPRLLKRLVQTNIIYGQYAVAEKYLTWLKKTIFYKEWAESQEKFLYHDNVVEKYAEYGMKRRCLIADNRFSGIHGLDDDLLYVARQTRGTVQCRTTLQYLASLYILAGYEKQFVSLCREFPQYELTKQRYFAAYYNKLNKMDFNKTAGDK